MPPGMILCTPHGETPVRFMEKLQKRAEDLPLAEDVAKRLTEGDNALAPPRKNGFAKVAILRTSSS